MGKRKKKKSKGYKSYGKNPIGLKFLFSFFMMFMVGIFLMIYAFTPFNNIPILQLFVASNYAYTTPIMLFNDLLPVFFVLSGMLATFFILYIFKKYW